jgi:hypothetical protein
MTCLRPHTVLNNVERFNALLDAQVWECGRSMVFLAGHRAWQLSYLAEVRIVLKFCPHLVANPVRIVTTISVTPLYVYIKGTVLAFFHEWVSPQLFTRFRKISNYIPIRGNIHDF